MLRQGQIQAVNLNPKFSFKKEKQYQMHSCLLRVIGTKDIWAFHVGLLVFA